MQTYLEAVGDLSTHDGLLRIRSANGNDLMTVKSTTSSFQIADPRKQESIPFRETGVGTSRTVVYKCGHRAVILGITPKTFQRKMGAFSIENNAKLGAVRPLRRFSTFLSQRRTMKLTAHRGLGMLMIVALQFCLVGMLES